MVLPGLGWALIRLVGWEPGPLVPLLAFTPYVAAWAVLPLVLSVALRRWWAGAAAALAVALLAIAVLPRMVPDGSATDQAVTDRTRIRVATVNLLAGAADLSVVMELLRRERVDVLMMQEFTPDAEAELDRLGVVESLPYRRADAEVGTTGSAVYSRFPLTDVGVRRNEGGFAQSYGTIQPPGSPPLLVESAHPMAPYAWHTLELWRTDLAAQPRPDPDSAPRILAGDFNATLDHAALRRLIAAGYVDAAAATGHGLVGTWGPYDGSWIPPVTLDRVLVDRRIGVDSVVVHTVPGSDHRMVVAGLVLPPP
ncbi:endonuclease/exonuclease/phosphatase family protein [Solwaraspora sp. WMMD406]|uniref:endonuclease/exonuclease/phosphatase family protein n=1 Tax=Solwaraspora sp. WMMD406 TaxID=3016095 RepID=UPI002416B1B5|nr:endonuclease/exonuclease/phosphatase family protein [Solwaraspora sp. WMMD406]MDG4767279.1 endonuclease/exonuclease/phosphatase family protein [Solwaraspora sp. WMMD406]